MSPASPRTACSAWGMPPCSRWPICCAARCRRTASTPRRGLSSSSGSNRAATVHCEGPPMNQTSPTTHAQHAALARMQQFMSASPVPSISTELLAMADGELNRELNHFLFDAPSDPHLLKGKRVAICCTNGVEEVEILGSMRWLREHGATVHIVAPKIGPFPDSLGLRFPPIAETHVLAIRLMENAGWLKIDTYLENARVADYDAVILPGGCWNPDFLRADKHAQDFTRDMYAAGKPTCGICHGPWVMVSARMLRGKRATAVW